MGKRRKRAPRLKYVSLALLLLAACALIAAACGSSSGGDTAGGSETSAATEGGETSAATGGDDVAKAEEELAGFLATPEKWEGPTQSVQAPKGVKLVTISCDDKLGGCSEIMKHMGQAAEDELGWTVKHYDGASNPQLWNQYMEQAVNEGADAIALSSINPLLVQKGLAAAEAAGVPVIEGNAAGFEPNPTTDPGGKPWPIASVDMNYSEAGAASAAWAIADSKGKANALVLTDPAYPSVVADSEGFAKALEENCEECVVSDTLKTEAANVTTKIPEEIVGYLRGHPEVEYVFTPYDPMAQFAVPAIEQAGLGDKVKVLSILGEPANQELIQQEKVQATDIAFDQFYVSWAMLDQLMRSLNGEELFKPLSENVPQQLIEKGNQPEIGPYKSKVPFEREFRKLWGIAE